MFQSEAQLMIWYFRCQHAFGNKTCTKHLPKTLINRLFGSCKLYGLPTFLSPQNSWFNVENEEINP